MYVPLSTAECGLIAPWPLISFQPQHKNYWQLTQVTFTISLEHYFAGNPQILTFMWKPVGANHPNKHPYRIKEPPPKFVPPRGHWSPNRTCAATSEKLLRSSFGTWKRTLVLHLASNLNGTCLKTYDPWRAVSVRGFTLSETIFGWVFMSQRTSICKPALRVLHDKNVLKTQSMPFIILKYNLPYLKDLDFSTCCPLEAAEETSWCGFSGRDRGMAWEL